MTITHDELDLTIQVDPPSPDMFKLVQLAPQSTVTPGPTPPRHVQPCSLYMYSVY